MMNVHRTMYGYVQGLAFNLDSEQKAEAESGMSDEQWTDSQGEAIAAATASGAYPTFTKIVAGLAPDYDADLDALFEFGLTRLLDGVAVLIASRAADPPPRRRA